MTTDKAHAYLPRFYVDEEYFYDNDKLPIAPPPASPPASMTGGDEGKASGGLVTVDPDNSPDGLYLERDDPIKDPLKDHPHYSGPSSSVGLPSHNTRWDVEEDELLREGIALHGYGKWKIISEHVKTRNPLQCKNRARHWQTTATAVTATDQHHHDGALDRDPLPTTSTSSLHHCNATANAVSEGPLKTFATSEELITTTASMATIASSSLTIGNTSAPKSEETAPGAAEIVQFDRETIMEHEKKGNPEWFTNKATSKTPERYIKIRNHILDSWQKEFKPEYMTKTAARRGLRDCGDVNAIGRVHAYLENLGAINQGCEPRKPPVVKRSSKRVFYYYDSDDEDGLTSNKRKSRPDDDYDVKVSSVNSKGNKARPQRVTKRPQHYYDADGQNQDDQFCLVPVEDYETNDLVAPFQLEVTSNALIVMDFHSHLAHTEVIGLLGGRYLHNSHNGNGQGTLYVESVFPCKGTSSTDIECEMDPESEMKAREDFASKGLSVVGWYHSHPTFEPNPSVRDIEYQNLYQALFRDNATGIEPFIGIIVNPFDTESVNDTPSRIQYIHIQHQWEGGRKRNIPYGFSPRITPSTNISSALVDQIKNLVDQFKDYDFKTDMTNGQRVDTLIESLRASLTQVTDENAHLLDVIRSSLDRLAL